MTTCGVSKIATVLRVSFGGWLLLAAAPAPAQLPAAPPVKILFVGNSFCHGHFLPLRKYNAKNVVDENFGLPDTDPRAEHPAGSGPFGGIPGVFKAFTDEASVPYEVHLEAISAKTLAYHAEHALPVIAQAQWDIVVLQGYSTEPLPEKRGGQREHFLKSATLLEQAVHAANPRTRVYLYETWPRADLTFAEKGRYAGEPIDTMAHDLHDGYYRAFAENGHFAGVAPVGDAWLAAIHSGLAQANPFLPGQEERIDLWGADDYHPSAEGAYLAALVLFEQITGKDPRQLGTGEQAAAALGIARPDATTLQRLAFEQASAVRPATGTPPPQN